MDWPRLVRLLYRRKPPLVARVIDAEGDSIVRQAFIVHDGRSMWFIDDGSSLQLTSRSGSVFTADEGKLRGVRDGGGLAMHTWAKMLIQPRLIAYLRESSGRVVGEARVEGRACWVAEGEGLKTDSSELFNLAVDKETGLVMELYPLGRPSRRVRLSDLQQGDWEDAKA